MVVALTNNMPCPAVRQAFPYFFLPLDDDLGLKTIEQGATLFHCPIVERRIAFVWD